MKRKTKEKTVNQQKPKTLKKRERELEFKPTFELKLVLFVIQKLYIKYRNLKDGLYLKKYNSS